MTRRGWLCGVVLLSACVERSLAGAEADVRVEPRLIEATTYVGHPVARFVSVTNGGRGAAELAVSATGGLTLLGGSVLEAPGGGALTVKFQVEARVAGARQETLTVGDAQVVVAVNVRAVPPCPAAAACRAVAFDVGTQACVESVVADGAACTAACVEGAHCQAGVCVGTAATCDDGDACTADACGPEGCAHAPVVCAPADEACQAAACDPVKGCVLIDAVDGTACGPNDCSAAHVCLAGRCQVTTSPEGSVCSAATPCLAQGRCVEKQCEAKPKPLTSAWQIPDDAKHKHSLLGVVSPGGLIYGVARTETDIQIVAWDAKGFERWRSKPITDFYATAALYEADGGRLIVISKAWARAFDAASGVPLWFVDLDAQIPLNNAGPDGKKQVYPIKVTLLPKSKRVVASYSEGSDTHVAWIFGLDLATGAQAFKIRRDGHLYGLMATATDALFFGTAGCWQPASWNASADAMGAVQWNVFQAGVPALTTGTALWFQPYSGGANYLGRIDLATGSMGQEAANGNTRAVLADGDVVYVQPGNSAGALTAWDSKAHKEKWTIAALPAGQSFLTSGGGVFAMSSTVGALFDGAGVPVWSCPFDAALTTYASASIVEGQVVAQTSKGIAAFPIGAVKLSPTGWNVSDRGTPERTSRAR